MKQMLNYLCIFLLIYTHNVFSGQLSHSSNNYVDVKAFPNNDINYFSNNTQSWRLVYAKLIEKPPYDPSDENHCDASEFMSDEVLAFDISDIIKHVGNTFDTNNIHVYYDGDSGRKALALMLNDAKIKNSVIAMVKALVNKGDSEYAVLTPDRLKKKLKLFFDDKQKNTVYMCFGYLQHLVTTPMQNSEKNTEPEVNPQKIVFWYDANKTQ